MTSDAKRLRLGEACGDSINPHLVNPQASPIHLRLPLALAKSPSLRRIAMWDQSWAFLCPLYENLHATKASKRLAKGFNSRGG